MRRRCPPRRPGWRPCPPAHQIADPLLRARPGALQRRLPRRAITLITTRRWLPAVRRFQCRAMRAILALSLAAAVAASAVLATSALAASPYVIGGTQIAAK